MIKKEYYGKWVKMSNSTIAVFTENKRLGVGIAWDASSENPDYEVVLNMNPNAGWVLASDVNIGKVLIAFVRNLIDLNPTLKHDSFEGVRDIKRDEILQCAAHSAKGCFLGSSFQYISKTDTLYNYGRGRIVMYEKGKFAPGFNLPDLSEYFQTPDSKESKKWTYLDFRKGRVGIKFNGDIDRLNELVGKGIFYYSGTAQFYFFKPKSNVCQAVNDLYSPHGEETIQDFVPESEILTVKELNPLTPEEAFQNIFQVGDRVQLSHNAAYSHSKANPRGIIGEVTEVKFSKTSYPISVRWHNGYRNEYKLSDLKLLNSKTNNYEKSVDSSPVNGPVSRRGERKQVKVSLGRRGDGLTTRGRRRTERSVCIGEGKRQPGEGLHPRRRTPRSFKL